MGKREYWFDEGARCLRMTLEDRGRSDILPAKGNFYACPLCLRIASHDDLTTGRLTVEHVPPKRLGGRELLLTCARCNHNAGSKLDAHAVRQALLDKVATGQVDSEIELDALFEFDGIVVRGVARSTNHSIHLSSVARRNDSRTEAAFVARSTEVWNQIDPSAQITVSIPAKSSPARATLSWVRAAYLAVFAALGWCYVLRPELDPIRQQLADPDTLLLSPIDALDPNADVDRRTILIVDSPSDVRSTVVMMGQRVIFLPAVREPLLCADLSQALSQYIDTEGRLTVQLAGKVVPWPRSPQYFLDRGSDEPCA